MASVKCTVTDPAFINGSLLQPGQTIMLDEKFLEKDKNGNRTLTPRWCIRMEAQEVESIPEIKPEPIPEPKEEKKKDIFAVV